MRLLDGLRSCRAVRYGDGFSVPDANREVYDRYIAELTRENRPIDKVRFASGFFWLIVSNDPEKTFNEAADHMIYQVNNYTAWLSKAGLMPNPVYFRAREQLRQSGGLKVVHTIPGHCPLDCHHSGPNLIWSCSPRR
jgi:hypothetical protein